jgi:hypothetical protein
MKNLSIDETQELVERTGAVPLPGRDTDEHLDEYNAIHEAGHAVVTLLLGVFLDCVRLMTHPREDGNGHGRCARGNTKDSEDEVLIKFAGVGAELIHGNKGMQWSWLFRGTGKSDWNGAQSYLSDIGGNRRAVVRNAKLKVTRLLQENWGWVLAVSHRLRDKRYLSGAEVAALAADSTPKGRL